MNNKKAFTIVETLIVLAVTSTLLISALAMISGKQGRTEFTTGVREIEGLLRDVLNDVNNGLLPDIGGLGCTAPGTGAPVLTYSATGGDTNGKNEQCVLAGKVVQLGTDTETDKYITYALAGRRLDVSGGVIKDFNDFKPIAVHPLNAGGVAEINSRQERALPWAVEVVKADGSPNSVVFGLVYKDFRGGNQPTGNIESGNSSIGLMLVPVNGLTNAREDLLVPKLSTLTLADLKSNINLCFKSGTSAQYAFMTLSMTGAGFDVSSEILDSLGGKTCDGA